MGDNKQAEENGASTDDVLEIIRKKLKAANEKFKAGGSNDGDFVNIDSDDEKPPVFEDDTDFDEVVLNENDRINPEEELKQNISQVKENMKPESDSLKNLDEEHEDDLEDEDEDAFTKKDEKSERDENAANVETETVSSEETDEENLADIDDDEELFSDDDEYAEDKDETEEVDAQGQEVNSLHKDITDFRGQDYMDTKRREGSLPKPKSLKSPEKENQKLTSPLSEQEKPSEASLPDNESQVKSKETLDLKGINSRFANLSGFASRDTSSKVPKKAIEKDEDKITDSNYKSKETRSNYDNKEESLKETDGKANDESRKVNNDSGSEKDIPVAKGFDSVFLEKIAQLIDKKLEDFTQKAAPSEVKEKPSVSLEELVSEALRPALEKWINNNQDAILNIIERVSESYMAEAFSKTKAKK